MFGWLVGKCSSWRQNAIYIAAVEAPRVAGLVSSLCALCRFAKLHLDLGYFLL